MPPRSEADADDLFTPAPLPVTRLDDRERLACLRLIRSENVGPITFRELINRFGGAEAALAAIPDLARRAGRTRPLRLCPEHTAVMELEAARRAGAELVFTIEPGYPSLLAQLHDPPPLLYVRGDRKTLSSEMVAIVGSRQASANGITMAQLLARDLAKAGYVIASGLARGIDGAAHRATLATGTIAVLAGGIDHVYPPENADLFRLIPEHGGAIVTDMPPGYEPRARDFPRRNRIISGMARGVVVVEATLRSGGMVTARLALEQGREVFAVPGHPFDTRAEGPNRLIQQGARLVSSADDIVQELGAITGRAPLQVVERAPANASFVDGPAPGHATGSTGASPDHVGAVVLAALGPSPIAVDALVRATGLSSRAVQVALMDLELSGMIERPGPQLVARRLQTP